MAAGIMFAVLLVLGCVVPSMATVYIVGDSMGWGSNVDYSRWVSGKTFMAGDSLLFNYKSGQHTVVEVSASDYRTCSVGNAFATYGSGSTSITLTTEGNRYFICGAIGHCGAGMKLAVSVGGGPTVTPPSPPSSDTSSCALPPAATTQNNTNTMPTDPSMTFSSSGTLSPYVAVLITLVPLFELVLS